MAMQKTHWFWDVAVLWPFIFLALIMFFAGFSFLLMGNDTLSSLMVLLMPLGVLIYIGSIVLMIVVYVYAIHRLYTRTNLSVEQKKTWLVLIILFNFITIPILHFMHLRVR